MKIKMKVYKKTIELNKPVDVIVYTQGIVWARGDNDLLYSSPHYSYGKTLLKLPNPPEKLTIFSDGIITDIEILNFNPDRRV